MSLKVEIIEKMAALLTVAFGLVAALAWNGAIRAVFAEVFGDPDELLPMIVYAVTVTIVAVIVIIWIAKVAEKGKETEEKTES